MKTVHLLLAILLVSVVTSAATAQNVAEAAREQRARKKAESKAVLTNSATILPKGAEHGTMSITTPSAGETAKTAGTETAAKGPTDNKGRDEKYWRTTFANARQELKRAEDKLTLLEARRNDLQGQLYRESVYTHEIELRQQIADTEKQQEVTRAEVEADQKKITDLEEELRRSGGLPGWAR